MNHCVLSNNSYKISISSSAHSLQALREVTIKNHKGIKEANQGGILKTQPLALLKSSQSGRAMYSMAKSQGQETAATFTLTQIKCHLLQEALPAPAPLLAGKESPSSASHLRAAFVMATGVLGCLSPQLDYRHLPGRDYILVTSVLRVRPQ